MATRRERVILDLEGNFDRNAARAAASALALDAAVSTLGDHGRRSSEGLSDVEKSSTRLGESTRKAGSEIDRYSGRLRAVADAAAILGPALVPISAVAVPAVAGLTASFGAAALAGGTAVLAFQGVGDALKAVNVAAIEPTSENLLAAQQAMDQLSPAAQELVGELQELRPTLAALSGAAATGFFPGLSDGIDALAAKAPQLEAFAQRLGAVMGSLSADAGTSLAGPEFRDFFDYVGREAPVLLSELGHAIGSVTHGLAELVTAAAPLNSDFSGWLEASAAGFDRWATGLSKTKGFQEFVDYVEAHGPDVADAVAAIGNAMLQIGEATAPLGGPVLRALTGVADAIAAIADSDAGPSILATVSALALLNRAQSSFGALSQSSFGKAVASADTLSSKVGLIARRTGPALAGVGLAASGIADGFGLANTATLALTGSIAGPWGAAVGAGVGLLLDFAGGQQKAVTDANTLTSTLDSQTGAITKNTAAYVAKQFADNGVLQSAQQLGLSLSDVTEAALGNQDAMGRVNGQLDATRTELAKPVAGRSVQDADDAATAYNQFADAADMVTGAISGTNGQLTSGQTRLSMISEATSGTASSFDQATSAARSFSDQMADLNAQLEGRASMRDYQASIDDFTKSLKQNGHNLDVNTEKGRANQAALDNIAATASKYAETLKGADRTNFLVHARAAFVDAAQKAGMSRQAAKGLADQLYDVGDISVKPKVLVDAANADRGLQNVHVGLNELDRATANPRVHVDDGNSLGLLGSIQAAVDRLHGKTIKVVTVNVNGHAASTTEPGAHIHSATGGHIRGPGTSTSDDIPAWLSDGEYVIRAAAVQHYGIGLFDDINAMALAGGGLATAELARYQALRDGYALAAGGPVATTRPWSLTHSELATA